MRGACASTSREQGAPRVFGALPYHAAQRRPGFPKGRLAAAETKRERQRRSVMRKPEEQKCKSHAFASWTVPRYALVTTDGTTHQRITASKEPQKCVQSDRAKASAVLGCCRDVQIARRQCRALRTELISAYHGSYDFKSFMTSSSRGVLFYGAARSRRRSGATARLRDEGRGQNGREIEALRF